MSRTAAPPALVLAAGLVALEGLGIAALGAVYAVRGLAGEAESVLGAELGGIMLVGLGALLLLVARGLLARRGWSRSPALVVQLLGALTAFSLAQGRVWLAALVVGALSLSVLGCLFSPPVRRALDLE